MKLLRFFIPLSLTAMASLMPTASASPMSVSKRLAQANDAWLDGRPDDLVRLTTEILADDAADEWVKKGASQLIEAAYRSGKGTIRATLRLPEGLEALEIAQRRLETENDTSYMIEVSGWGDRDDVADVRLVRNPDQTLIEVGPDMLEGDAKGFWIKRKFDKPIADGLFRIVVKMKKGEVLDRELPITNWVASDAPEIIEPQPEQSVATGNPVVAWQVDGKTSASFRRYRFHASVIYSDAPNWGWDKRWTVDGDFGSPTRYVVGRDGQGVSSLDKGRYLLDVVYKRKRRIGDIDVASEANARSVFYVR